MNAYRQEAFKMLLSSCTEHPTDRQRALIAFQACNTPDEMNWVRSYYLKRRMDWLDWHCVGQRKWQASVSRRPQRQRHHDSGSIREKYVTGR